MNLYTLDEARTALAASARTLVAGLRTDDPFVVATLLWGAGDVDDVTLDVDERRCADRHRRLLDRLNAAGYGPDVADELDGISSALGLDDGRLDRIDLDDL